MHPDLGEDMKGCAGTFSGEEEEVGDGRGMKKPECANATLAEEEVGDRRGRLGRWGGNWREREKVSHGKLQ